MTEPPKPDYARNMRIVGHTDQGGRPDGVQVMVHRGFAFVGHMFSKGFSVIDVRDAKKPRAVNYIAAPANTWNIHLQVHEDLLLVIHAKDMFAAAEFADERAYYSGALGKTVGTAETAWARSFLAALRPHRVGVYVNFLDADDDSGRVREAYGDHTYHRLAEIKARYDPENVFLNNKNIQPDEEARRDART